MFNNLSLLYQNVTNYKHLQNLSSVFQVSFSNPGKCEYDVHMRMRYDAIYDMPILNQYQSINDLVNESFTNQVKASDLNVLGIT